VSDFSSSIQTDIISRVLTTTGNKLKLAALLKCMSFNPAGKQANAADANKANALNPNDASATADADETDQMFKMRTFDLFWVDKSSLMHRDGFAKVCMCLCMHHCIAFVCVKGIDPGWF